MRFLNRFPYWIYIVLSLSVAILYTGAGQVILNDFSMLPERFMPGDNVQLEVQVENTGGDILSGDVRIDISNCRGSIVYTNSMPFSVLLGGGSTNLSCIWSNQTQVPRDCQVSAYIVANNTTSAVQKLSMWSNAPFFFNAIARLESNDVELQWPSVSNRTYILESATNLCAEPRYVPVVTNIAATPPVTSYVSPTTSLAFCIWRVREVIATPSPTVEPTAIPSPTPTPAPIQTLYVLHSSDIHESSAHIAKLSSCIKAYKSNYVNVVAMDCGDFFDAYGGDYHGIDSDIYRRNPSNETGRAMAEIMGAIPYDAIILGNHDYSVGLNRLATLISSNDLPVFGANVFVNSNNVPFEVGKSNYKKIDFNGFSVGIVGACSTINHYQQWHNQTNMFVAGRIDSHFIHDAVNAASLACDFVIFASHQTWSTSHPETNYNEKAEDTDLYTFPHIQNVDYIAAAHDHVNRYTNNGSFFMSETTKGGEYINVLEVAFDITTKQVVGYDFHHEAVSSFSDDPEMVAILNKYPQATNSYSRKYNPDLPDP